MSASDTVRYAVTHRTEYAYEGDVLAGYNVAHLIPRSTPVQSCIRSAVHVDPVPDDLRERADYFGNRATWFSVHQSHRHLSVTATSEVEVRPEANADGWDSEATTLAWETAAAQLLADTDPAVLDAREYRLPSPMVGHHPGLDEMARASFTPGRSVGEAAVDLMGRIHREVAYVPGATSIATPIATVLEDRRGVCQDLAHPIRGRSVTAGWAAAEAGASAPGASAAPAWASARVPARARPRPGPQGG